MISMEWIKPKKLSVFEQFVSMKRLFPGDELKLGHNNFTWVGYLKSSPLGNSYKVKIVLEKDKNPDVFIVDPVKLALAEGKTKLEHVYDHQKQKLCLYYFDDRGWNSTKLISNTIIPWTIEWLYHYEIWLVTGDWLGGGKHPISANKE